MRLSTPTVLLVTELPYVSPDLSNFDWATIGPEYKFVGINSDGSVVAFRYRPNLHLSVAPTRWWRFIEYFGGKHIGITKILPDKDICAERHVSVT